MISDIESLHSFNSMLNRTRRKDIQDFCIRRSFTVETKFTEAQYQLHSELLRFEYEALSKLHNIRSIPFMMSTIRRQAASCIFGLAPQIRDIIERRFNQMVDDPDVDVEEYDLDGKASSALMALAQRVLLLADELPEDDPKFDSVVQIINEKQKQDNNKIILFSTFRHTLAYVKRKLLSMNYRVAQIDGSVKDEVRCDLRAQFELPKEDENAIGSHCRPLKSACEKSFRLPCFARYLCSISTSFSLNTPFPSTSPLIVTTGFITKAFLATGSNT